MRPAAARLLAGIAAAVALVLLAAGPAGAHSSLASTEPAASSTVPAAPAQVVLRFDQPVDVTPGAIRVFDRDGDRVDGGRQARRLDGAADAVAMPLPRLAPGGYVVAWRLVSGDAHPIRGAFTFSVGRAGAPEDLAEPVDLRSLDVGGSAAVGTAHGVARFAAFAGTLALLGAVGLLAAAWPGGWGARAVRRLVVGSLAVALAATAALLLLQGPYAAGLGLGDAFDGSVVGAVLDTGFGQTLLVRLAMLAAIGACLPALRRRPRHEVVLPLALGAAGLVVGATAFGGHAGGDAGPLWLFVDVAHLAAAAAWLGGLALLAVGLGGRATRAELAPSVPAFSRAALVMVLAVVGTGLAQSWRQVGEPDALGTSYGRLLLAKVALVALLVGVAWWSRRLLRRAGGAVGALARSVAGEAALGLAVLAATAALVVAQPAREALARPFSAELEAPPLLIDVTVERARAGRTDVHAYTLDLDGQLRDVDQVQLSLTLPEEDLGPLALPVRRAGPGHFAAYGVDLPLPGRWSLDVVATTLTGQRDQVAASTTFTVR